MEAILTLLDEVFFNMAHPERSQKVNLSMHVVHRDRQQTFPSETESLQQGR